jgi:hypothetical protein
VLDLGNIFTQLSEDQEEDPMLIDGMEGTDKRLQLTYCLQELGNKDAAREATTTHIILAPEAVETKFEEGEIECSHTLGGEVAEIQMDLTNRVLMELGAMRMKAVRRNC